MFARPPREPEWLSWLFVGLWTSSIYLSIPYVRGIVNRISEVVEREVFLYGVDAIGLCLTAVAIATLRKRPQVSIANYLWLIAVTAFLVAYTSSLRKNPEEAVHFVEYGVLSLLLYRAFSHRTRDSGIYLLAATGGAILGMLDEAMQWIAPNRIWDAHDIMRNASAVALVQIAVWQGIRPPIISKTPHARRVTQICRFAAFALLLLGLCFINTPRRIAWYGERIAPLVVLAGHGEAMIEYGYLFEDPDTGIFRSRLKPEALREQDQTRAIEGAEVLDRYSDTESYRAFLEIYTPATDPFLHEARVHLFRRDLFLQRAEEAEDVATRRSNITVAYWENRIMERYFPGVFGKSGYVWDPKLKAWIEQEAERDSLYESAVTQSVVTILNERQAIWLFVVAIVVLLAFGEVYGRVAASRS